MKSKSSKKAIFIIIIAVILLFISGHIFISRNIKRVIQPNDRQNNTKINADTQNLFSEVEKLIINKMNQGKIPGLSVAIVKDGQTAYKAGFGYANIETGEKVTSDTLFQLGSNSKAFTSLGVFQLQKDGLINLNDPISKYIPWLKLLYKGKETDVTIAEFLHHTSGISSNTIYRIPELNEENDNAIEKTVRTIVGLELVSRPGTKYEYATINYDVLGLLIEKASGIKYEDYIQKYVLDAAGLNNTYMFKSKANATKLASGYKLGFLLPQYYNAPWYEGNKPAGYIISSANDMAAWLKIQMDTSKSSSLDTKLIAQAQFPNLSVDTFGEEMAYAAGWIVHNNAGTEILHSGSNPNFSSFIIFRSDEKTGVAILCNTNTAYAMDIAQSIIKLFSSSQSSYTSVADYNQKIDQVCTAIIFILFFVICVTLYSLMSSIYQFVTKEEKLYSLSKKTVIKIFIISIIFVMISCIIYFLPSFLFNGATWGYMIVWYPVTVKIVLYSIYTSLCLLFCNIVIKIIRKNSSL